MIKQWNQRISVEEYRQIMGLMPMPKKAKATGGSGARKRLAIMVFLNALERRAGIFFGGTWKKGMEAQPNVLYLEYPAIKGRRFRFDLAIPSQKLLIDIQGGAGVIRTTKDGKLSYGGAHHSIEGRRRDIEKNNLARIYGFDVIECEWRDVESGQLLTWVEQLCGGRLDQG